MFRPNIKPQVKIQGVGTIPNPLARNPVYPPGSLAGYEAHLKALDTKFRQSAREPAADRLYQALGYSMLTSNSNQDAVDIAWGNIIKVWPTRANMVQARVADVEARILDTGPGPKVMYAKGKADYLKRIAEQAPVLIRRGAQDATGRELRGLVTGRKVGGSWDGPALNLGVKTGNLAANFVGKVDVAAGDIHIEKLVGARPGKFSQISTLQGVRDQEKLEDFLAARVGSSPAVSQHTIWYEARYAATPDTMMERADAAHGSFFAGFHRSATDKLEEIR